MLKYEEDYRNLCQKIIDEGVWVDNARTSTKRLTIPTQTLEYDASCDQFPLLTIKQSFPVSAVAEMLGYLRGYGTADQFEAIGAKTWRSNTDEAPAWVHSPVRKGDGDMGQAYRFRNYRVLVETPEINEDGLYPTTGTIPYKQDLVEPDNNEISANIENPYTLLKYGNCIGEVKEKPWYFNLLYHAWEDLFLRIEQGSPQSDVKVCDRWLIFANFLEDFKKIPGWQLKLEYPEEYTLDKDWCGSRVYKPNTVQWCNKKGQMSDNIEKDSEGYTAIDIDQVREVYCKLKHSGDDHRLIMTAWHPHTKLLSCLMPCMHTHTFTLLGDTLHLTSTQRSFDAPLGGNFNAIQCVFLLKIMAKITGYKPGKVTHTIINPHIYDNQIDKVKEMLEREPDEDYHTVKIADWVTSLGDIEKDIHAREYFTVENYKHQGRIDFPFTA